MRYFTSSALGEPRPVVHKQIGLCFKGVTFETESAVIDCVLDVCDTLISYLSFSK